MKPMVISAHVTLRTCFFADRLKKTVAQTIELSEIRESKGAHGTSLWFFHPSVSLPSVWRIQTLALQQKWASMQGWILS